MSVSSITSSAANSSAAPNTFGQQFSQLIKSINSGDLAGA
jgi:hypothetical protein